MLDVIGIGTIAVDYFFEISSELLRNFDLKPEDDVSFSKKKLTQKKILKKVETIAKSPGGMATNTIRILSKLSCSTGIIGNIGKGKDAVFLKNKLKEIDTVQLMGTGNTHICFCLLSDSRRKRAFIYKENEKENDIFKNINIKYLNNSKIVYITPVYLKNQRESFKEIKKIINEINGPKVIFTPGVYYSELGIDGFLPILKKINILFLNKNEIKLLTKKNEYEGSCLLVSKGVKIVVCTLGDKGVLITTNKKQELIKVNEIKKIVDTTGSGDSFAAGFIYGCLKNYSTRKSVKIGNKIAALNLKSFGLSWLENSSFENY